MAMTCKSSKLIFAFVVVNFLGILHGLAFYFCIMHFSSVGEKRKAKK